MGGVKVWIAAAGAALALGAAGAASAQSGERSVWDGLYTADQAAKGRGVYDQRCASCHGPQLSGGDSAPALAGPAFLNNWNGTTAADLHTRIKETMPVDEPGSLSGRQVSELQAFIFQSNNFPAGQAALPNDPAMQSATKILATKP